MAGSWQSQSCRQGVVVVGVAVGADVVANNSGGSAGDSGGREGAGRVEVVLGIVMVAYSRLDCVLPGFASELGAGTVHCGHCAGTVQCRTRRPGLPQDSQDGPAGVGRGAKQKNAELLVAVVASHVSRLALSSLARSLVFSRLALSIPASLRRRLYMCATMRSHAST